MGSGEARATALASLAVLLADVHAGQPSVRTCRPAGARGTYQVASPRVLVVSVEKINDVLIVLRSDREPSIAVAVGAGEDQLLSRFL